jgi:hypothetical protein
MIRNDWTQAEIETLSKHRAEGLSAGSIAKIIGRSRNSVLGKVMRLGLEKLDPHKCQYPNGRTAKRNRYPPKPKIIVVEPVLPETELRLNGKKITIGTIERGMCRFPHGDGAKMWFCGHPIDAPSPYCGFHRSKAWVKPHTTQLRGAK